MSKEPRTTDEPGSTGKPGPADAPRSTVNLAAARRFLHENARLLDRHRAAVLLDDAPTAPARTALCGYRTADGGWGHALEPDLRGPDSQVSAAMSALEVLAGLKLAGDPLVDETLRWLRSVTLPDGSVPHVLPTAADHPRAPWMRPNTSGFLTFRTAAQLWRLDVDDPWLDAATVWCWQWIENREPTGYQAVFALNFLDAVPDRDRAARAVERIRPALRPDGTIPIAGGVDGEHVTPVRMSPRPGTPSRALFGDELIESGLDALERDQRDDGGWDFDFLHWCPGQVVEWRGIVTVDALETLRANGRLAG